MGRQVAECLELLARLGRGEDSLCKVRMSANDRIDLYRGCTSSPSTPAGTSSRCKKWLNRPEVPLL
jgi:hypothetical protein